MSLRRIRVGERFEARELPSVSGRAVLVPDPHRLTHLQLRRFAGCPACNLHLRALARRSHDLEAAGIREVVVFRASAERLRESAERLPFELVGDPEGALYRELGVGRSPRAIADPRAWPALVRGASQGLAGGLAPGEDPLTLPADFLLDASGRVLACKYGVHADDQWSADEILLAARRAASEGDPMQTLDPPKKLVGYWITTLAVALLFTATGIANLLRASHIVADMAHLGYPTYFPTLLGAWKVLGAAIVLAPRFPRLKEWAYAGMIFDLTSAAFSRGVAGDGAAAILVPLLIGCLVLASWTQRPASRRLSAIQAMA